LLFALVLVINIVSVPFCNAAFAAGSSLPGYPFLTGSAQQEPYSSGPLWTDIFNADGTVNNLHGGRSAEFIEENISSGVATDMSTLLSGSLLDNGIVPSLHDLGNSYVYSTSDTEGNLVLFTGLEHLGSVEGTSFIDVEFTQDIIFLQHGSPWPIYGKSSPGDLLIRVNLSDSLISSVEIKEWITGEYQTIEISGPLGWESCSGNNTSYVLCIGAPVAGLPPTNNDVWDLNFNPVTVPSANSFIEVGVNVGRLLGTNPHITGVTIWTPEDIALGTDFLTWEGE
jgi:hypothetical protein